MKTIIIALFLGFSVYQTRAQQTLSIGTADTKANAVLYLKGDGTQGLIIPVTTNHTNIAPTEGMIVYNSTDGKIYKCNGTSWSAIEGGSGSGTDSQNITITGNTLQISGGNTIPIANVAPTQAGQLFMWDGLKWTTSSATAPTSGQVLKWNAATQTWEAGTDNGTAYTAGTGVNITGTTITNTGDTDATNDITTATTATGDLTGTFPGLTVAKLQGQTVSPTPPTAGQVLQFVAGTWTPQNLATGGTVTNVTGTAPINVATGTTTPVISLANTAVIAGPYGTTTAIPQITVDAQGRLTAAANVSIPTANTSTTGLLTNTDWNTFNSKLTNPLTTTGDLLFHNGTTTTRLPSASGVLKSTGTAAAPAWSALAAADIPALDATKITTGTLAVARGGTGNTLVTNGGIAYGAAGNFAFTPVGTAGQILTSNGTGAPTWTNPGLSSTLTSANIFVGNASNVATAVAMSGDATLSNTGAITLTNSSATRTNLGLGSFATLTNPLTTNGDLLYGTAATPTRLPVGSNGQVLTVTGGLPSWQPATGFANPMTAGNDMIIGGASGTPTRLAAPSTNQVLTSDGSGVITWSPHLATVPRTANLVFASPNGAGGVPTFRTLVDADIAASAGIAGSKVTPAFGAQNISTTSGLAVGTASEFSINSTGNITKINNVTTSFPAAQGAANSFLKNDGAGNLSWATAPTNTWAITGNTGTSPATNFIGTTDNVALKFKTNNNISGLIDPVNSNVFYGYIAGQTTTGQQNVAIGTNALTANTSGGRNTAVGTLALSNTTGSGNIGIGMSALTTNTTGSNNIALGFNADVATGNLTNAIAIGTNSKITQSNAMALGGTGTDAINVGINTTSPTERLDVVGNLKFSGTLMPNNVPGTPGQVLTSTGGTTAPVWSNVSGWGLTGNTGTSPSANFIGTTDAQDLIFKTNSLEAFRISTAANNVGIGTSAPGAKLEVTGTTRFSDNVTITGFSSRIENNNTTSGQSAGALQVLSSGDRSIDNDAMNIQNLATKTGGSGSTKTGLSIISTGAWAPSTGQTNRGLFVNVAGADNNYSAIFSGGNVGISTLAPTERLDVVGNLKFSGALMPNNSPGTAGQVLTSAGAGAPPTWTNGGSGWGLTGNAGTTPTTNFIGTTDAQDLVFKANNTESFRVTSATGNVGIGTTAPAQKLDVIGYIRVGAGTGTANDGLTLASPAPGFSSIIAGARASNQFQISQTNNAPMTFLTNNVERMRIDGTGALTFGTTNTANGAGSVAFGSGSAASGTLSTAFGSNNIASGSNSTSIGQANTASGARSFAGGVSSVASGNGSTALGEGALAGTRGGFAIGHYNIGGGSSSNFVSTDPVFEVGIGASSATPANALTVLHGGNVGIGTSTPASRLQVSGGDIDVVGGEVTRSGATGSGVNMLPIAYFCVIGGATPSLGAAKTSNVTSVTFVGTGDYQYTIAGEDFSTITNYVVVATLIGSGGGQIRVTSSGTNLEILTYNAAGSTLTNQSYSVVIYKP